MAAALTDKLIKRIRQGDGCWEWLGTVNNEGYGSFTLYPNGKQGGRDTRTAHRLVYETFVGPIPEGMTLDHLCHTADGDCAGGPTCAHRRCVKPTHLAPTPFTDNVLRGVGPTAVNARKTHCIHGHPFDQANTYIRPATGNRDCRVCIDERLRRSRGRGGWATR